MQQVMNRVRRDQRGAAAVEFALIAGVLVMLIFGMLQFGLVFFEIQNLRAATREGARIGAVGALEQEIRDRVQSASYGAMPANNGALSVTPAVCPEAPGIDDTIRVEIDVNPSNPTLPARLRDIFTLDIPFMPPISIDTTVFGEFRCERGPA